MFIENFHALRLQAQKLGPKRVVVAMADDEVALSALAQAVAMKIAMPVLIGDEARIREKLAHVEEGAALRHAGFRKTAAGQAPARVGGERLGERGVFVSLGSRCVCADEEAHSAQVRSCATGQTGKCLRPVRWSIS